MMLIAGALGHARELAGILADLNQLDNLFFFDDVSATVPEKVWRRFRILRSLDEVKEIFSNDPRFIIGVGKPRDRKFLFHKMITAGGIPYSIISPFARIGHFNTTLGEGLNIMTGAVITEDIEIKKGTLIHNQVNIHHDCRIGEFCELSPACQLLGRVSIGNLVSIGSGAIILPDIVIGDEAIVGAGSVVTKNIPAGSLVKGNPAR